MLALHFVTDPVDHCFRENFLQQALADSESTPDIAISSNQLNLFDV